MKSLLKKIYEYLPFKRETYLVLRRYIKLPHNLHQYFYFTGVFPTVIGNKKFLMRNYGYQFHVENEYFWGGIYNGWEKTSTRLWIKLCSQANIIFDIGANTGCFSLIAKTLRPNADIHAFEPLDGVLKKLRHNVELNNYDIHVHDIALSDYSGTAKVYPTSLDHVYSVTVNKNLFEGSKVYEQTIRTKRLDEFISENKIGHIDLMKIDVETHEVQVLEGFGKYLTEMKPDMLIEIQTEKVADGIRSLIAGLGYQYYNIDEEKGIRKVDDIGKSDWLNYLICSKKTAERLGLPQSIKSFSNFE